MKTTIIAFMILMTYFILTLNTLGKITVDLKQSIKQFYGVKNGK